MRLDLLLGLVLTVLVGPLGRAAQPNPALLDAAAKGDAKAVKALLDAGADANTTAGGWTALHAATTPEVAELLIARGAKVNTLSTDLKDVPGFSPLHGAVANNRAELVETLLKHKADPNQKERCGVTPLFAARTAVMVQLLLDNKAEIDARDGRGATAMIVGASDEALAALMAAGADKLAADKYGRTALHRAAEAGWADICEWLVQKGADVNAKDALGRTALFYARTKETLDRLVIYGAKEDAADVFGHKPNLTEPTGLPFEKRLEKGMTPEQVEAAFDGPPAVRVRAKESGGDTWWFRGAAIKVVFQDGKARSWEKAEKAPAGEGVTPDACGR